MKEPVRCDRWNNVWETLHVMSCTKETSDPSQGGHGSSGHRTSRASSPVQFSRSVMSNSLRPHESQYARPPCPSPILGVYPDSCPSRRWCQPAISSCCPFLLLPSIPPSIRIFSSESTLCMRWSKYWSFSISICPSNERPGLVSFRMDWLDLLAVQGTRKSLLQHHIKFQKHQFFCI